MKYIEVSRKEKSMDVMRQVKAEVLIGSGTTRIRIVIQFCHFTVLMKYLQVLCENL